MTGGLRRNKAQPDAASRVQAAKQRKARAGEELDAAWRDIGTKKNSDADKRKLAEVKAAMDNGELARDPEDMYAKNGRLKAFSKAEALRLYPRLVEQNRAETLRKMVENTPSNYRLITSEPKFSEMLNDLLDEPIIAVDTETTGLDVYTDHIVGISLTLPRADYHVYIPVAHDAEAGEQLTRDYVLGGLRPFIVDEALGKVLHNANYDIQMFLRYDIELRGLRWDTQHAMPLLNENEPSFALKNLASRYLDEPSDTFAELFGKNAKFNTISLDVALVYAAKDTDLTWRLYEFQRKHMSQYPSILEYYETVEVPLIPAIVAMERTGFHIDTEYAKEYGEEMRAEIDRIRASLADKLGDVNLNSPAQLKPALEQVTGRKLDSTDAKKVLKPLSKQYEVIAELLEYKNLTKLYSTYISVLPDLIHPVTGRLHARFNPMGAKTGRFSSGGNGVNLQNQPKDARKLFVAPHGYVIMGGDWSQQEVRCAAYLTQEPVLLEAYEEGRDVYASMASEVYDKPYEECGDGTYERKSMKVGVLASLYGTGPATLAQQLGITKDEAKAFLDDFFARLPKVKEWIDETKTYCRKHGYVWMDREQRKRRLPDATKKYRGWSPERGEVMRALRQGPNAVVQGTSAIQTKATMIKLHELCDRKGWHIWCVVHDEALLLVPETVTREEVAEFEDVMLNTYQFGNVRNKTDIELMRKWGEGISVDEWFAKNNEGA
jgi:DNA polymerase-1